MGDGLRAAVHGSRRNDGGRRSFRDHADHRPSLLLGQRPAVPLIACGLVVGILLGLLVGWQVWPVQWYDTDPSDLRLQHQASYVLLVSDSLAVTGDIEAARQHLAELTDGDTTWHQVANLVERVAAEREAQGDAAAALRLRRMAQATGLPLATSTEFDPRAGARRPMTLLYVAVAVVLVGLGVAGYLYRLRLAPTPTRLRTASPARRPDRAAPATTRAAPPVPSSILDLQGDEDEDLVADEVAEAAPEEDLAEGWEEEPPGEPPPDAEDVPAAEPVSIAVVRPGNGDAFLAASGDDEGAGDWEEDEEPAEPTVDAEPEEEQVVTERVVRGAAAPVEAPEVPLDALGLFDAEYILGDDDFDASFTIESPEGEFLGECGVGMTDVLAVESGVQRADAFEVWLFDKSDIRTVTKVLVSEQAFRDEARCARLMAKGDLVVAQPGLEVILETLSLRVTVTVRGCEFSEGSDGPEGYFVRLDLELLAESSDAVP